MLKFPYNSNGKKMLHKSHNESDFLMFFRHIFAPLDVLVPGLRHVN